MVRQFRNRTVLSHESKLSMVWTISTHFCPHIDLFGCACRFSSPGFVCPQERACVFCLRLDLFIRRCRHIELTICETTVPWDTNRHHEAHSRMPVAPSDDAHVDTRRCSDCKIRRPQSGRRLIASRRTDATRRYVAVSCSCCRSQRPQVPVSSCICHRPLS